MIGGKSTRLLHRVIQGTVGCSIMSKDTLTIGPRDYPADIVWLHEGYWVGVHCYVSLYSYLLVVTLQNLSKILLNFCIISFRIFNNQKYIYIEFRMNLTPKPRN